MLQVEPAMATMPITAATSIPDTSPWTETENAVERPVVTMAIDTMAIDTMAIDTMAIDTMANDDEEDEEDSLASLASSRTLVATLSSMLFHLTLMIVLGMWMIPPLEGGIELSFLSTDELLEEEDPFETVLLNEDLRPAADLVMAGTDSPTPGAAAGATGSMGFPDLALTSIEQARRTTRTASSRWTPLGMGIGDLMTELSQGSPTATSVVVDDYRQALDRITQEILEMLAQRKVLLIWCFDQSESMKDDQQEIRSRIELVYNQLDALGAIPDDELTTAVTSFGKDFAMHTPKPTVELDEIRAAIDAVPIDPSGEEMMCRAVCESIVRNRLHASADNRQLALILVTDESGQQQESLAYLESTIQQASAVRCKVYVLGREAVFGYPYAKVRWVHPETGGEHLLPVDRGPETALLEQLQTEGFEARTDAHPSGFGPYAQSRLAWQTGGIFFMLPSHETNLVQADPRRYDRAIMEPYKPDLRSRQTILADYQRRPLPSLICKLVQDLNPYSKEGAAMMKMRDSFSADKEAFASQLLDARAKADRYLAGLQRGVDVLDRQEVLREKEKSRRWQANYDLIRAQMVNYAARTRLYLTALDAAVEKIAQTPPVLPNNERLVGWKVCRGGEVPVDETVTTMLERSRQLYLAVIENHAGTPWAARAEWELNRHFNYPGGFDAETAANTYASVGGVGSGVGVDVTVARGIGGGGGGGFGGVALVAEYRTPRPPSNPGAGAAPRPKNDTPRPTPSPVPKL
ncbi:MAG: vWA domain-containing protein [Thermoguttaceae bacterium]